MKRGKNTIRKSLATAALVGSAVMAAAPFAGAGAPMLSVNPGSAHAGETVAVSGGCSADHVTVAIFPGTFTGNSVPSGTPVVTVTLDLDGSNWDHDFQIPPGTAAGAYTVNSECPIDGPYYNNVPLTVLADEATTTTTMAPTTTVASEAKPAAVAVPATPKYTG